ncbi:hypothetical protein [Piscibacillus salipiscarius]|uniref:hypothetical protein n=1 Tax=Piscibacillus salipiscarius TaxID=299480 RepID=UPI002436715E|nr:hypothetical protein [Piscibacillus salipiscarius]
MTAHYGELDNGDQIIWMLIIQIFILVVGNLLHNLNAFNNDQNVKKNGITVTGVIALTFGLSSLLLVLFPLIRKVFYLIINGIISLFTFLLAPFFNWVETIEPEQKDGEIEQQDWEDRGQEKQEYTTLDSEPVITSEHILVVFLMLVAIIILIVVFKNREQLLSKINFNKDQGDLVSNSSRQMIEGYGEGKRLLKRRIMIFGRLFISWKSGQLIMSWGVISMNQLKTGLEDMS